MNRFCDQDCNHCPIVNHKNSKMVTVILNALLVRFGEGVYDMVQQNCPNLTVCFDCRTDDFTHTEGCELLVEGRRQGVIATKEDNDE